jgi:nucleotide-binding universal stress UspA family protein
MRRVLIATDGSGASRAAVETGLELTRKLTGVATIVFVRQPPPVVVDVYDRDAAQALHRRARAAVEQATGRAVELGVEAESEILDGDPVDEILELARTRRPDLIVVGSRARGVLARTFLGSVSSAIVQRAQQPVLVVKQPAKAARRAP